MKSKYIILEQSGMEIPVVFSRFLQHEDLAVALKHRVCSAGFCELGPAGKWIAGGESVSLKLNSRPQDAEILNAHLGNGSLIFQPAAPTAANSSLNAKL